MVLRVRGWLLTVLILLGVLRSGHAQMLRFGNHRDVVVPKKGTIVAGPYSLTVGLTQTAGYWYTKGTGAGTDYLRLYRRGIITGEGSDFPLTTTLTLRNYLAVTPRVDVDFSLSVHYEHYPLDTQEDQFYVSATDEGIYGTFSSEIMFTPCLRGRIYDNLLYRTDYVDLRGVVDRYGGERYVFLDNTVGFDLDWRLARDKNVPFSVSRTDHIPRDDAFSFREFVAHKITTGYEQEVFQGVTLGVSLYYSVYDFADPDRLDFESKGGSLNLNLAKGLEAGIPISEASTLSLSLGYTHGYTYGMRAQTDVEEVEYQEGESNVATLTGSATLKTYLRRDLTHSLHFTRYVEPGYAGGTYIADRYGYVLAWTPVLSHIRFSTSYSDVDAQGLESDYEDWTTRLSVRGPLTAFSWIEGLAQYSHRWNATPTVRRVAGRDEVIYDYITWTTRLGGGLALARNLDFEVWAEHTERSSESSTLNYSRNTIAAILVYHVVFD